MNPILWEWTPVPRALLSFARILRLQNSARPLNTANATCGTRGGGPSSGRTLSTSGNMIWVKNCEKSDSWSKPIFLSHLKALSTKGDHRFLC
ncbi:hypothetical protein L345_11672, partial [Ophiophagus hannah]